VEKSPDAFRTISEVADELDVPQHVLRFWESRFREIRPMKRGGGRRYYRPDDVDLLRGIRHLLYGEGYTIRGVQRLLREQGQRFVQNVWQPGAPQPTHQPSPEDAADEEAESDAAPEAARAVPRAAPPAAGLKGEDRQKLQAALHELSECRRLLDAVLSEPS
jgi:DNA-binding transcriptional MerR regulator